MSCARIVCETKAIKVGVYMCVYMCARMRLCEKPYNCEGLSLSAAHWRNYLSREALSAEYKYTSGSALSSFIF